MHMTASNGELPAHSTLQNVFLMIGCVVLAAASINSFYQVCLPARRSNYYLSSGAYAKAAII